jgi:hypothetical protein
MTRFTASIAVVFAAAVFAATPAPARAEELTLEQQIQMVRSLTAAERQATLARSVAFTDEEGRNFWPAYRDYRNEVAALDDRTLALVDDFAENYEALSTEKAKAIADEWLAVEKKRLALKEKYVKRYQKFLPGPKLVRVLQVENRLDLLVQLRLARNVPLVDL